MKTITVFCVLLLFGILTGCTASSEAFRSRVESIELHTAGDGQYGREIRAKFVLRDPRAKQQRTTSDAK